MTFDWLLPSTGATSTVTISDSLVPGLSERFCGELPSRWASYSPIRRRDYLAGRVAAHRALRRLGSDVASVPQGSGGEPLFPPGMVGSISHTGSSETFALAAVARELLALGVDVEVRDPEVTLGEEVLSVGEARLLSRVAPQVSPALLAFSLKESVFKCLYSLRSERAGFRQIELVSAVESDSGRGDVSARARLEKGEISASGRWILSRELIASSAWC